MFIFAVILIILAVVVFLASRLFKFHDYDGDRLTTPNKIMLGVSGLLVLLAIVFTALSSFYSQGVGEARVIKSFTGQVVGFNDRAGLAFKAPWDDTIPYDILNQQAIFSLDANVHADQKQFQQGGAITITDKDGVSADVDVAVRYSIRADQVQNIYSKFGDQNAFTAKLITQDMRSVVREVPNSYSTIDVITKRSQLEGEILKGLQSRWESQGVQVDSVALQDVRYPQSVTDAYAAAQNSRTAATKAQADLDAAKISAQQQVVSAQAQAQANDILSKSLTPEILQQRQLDVLSQFGAKGNAIVIQGGSGTPLIQVPSK